MSKQAFKSSHPKEWLNKKRSELRELITGGVSAYLDEAVTFVLLT